MMFMLRNKNDDFKDFYFMAFPSAATIYVAFCRETLKLSQPGKNELSGALLAYAGFILEILLCYGTSAELCRRSSSTRCLWAELTEYPLKPASKAFMVCPTIYNVDGLKDAVKH